MTNSREGRTARNGRARHLNKTWGNVIADSGFPADGGSHVSLLVSGERANGVLPQHTSSVPFPHDLAFQRAGRELPVQTRDAFRVENLPVAAQDDGVDPPKENTAEQPS